MKEKPLTEFLKTDETEEVKKESKQNRSKSLDGPWELPEGWKWVRLGDVFIEDKTSINPQEFPEKEFWLVTMDNVESHTGKLIKRVIVKGKDIQSTKYIFNEEHILYGKLRPYLNKVYEPDGKGICTTEFVPFRIKDRVDKRFVALYLRSPWVVEYANSLTKGARQPRVRIKDLLKYPIPLPPLEEQKRIVAKLDEIYAKLEEAKRLAREAKEQAEKLMASALHEVFSKADERGWEWVKLKDIAKHEMGGTPKKGRKEYWENGEIPWITASEIPSDSKYVTTYRFLITKRALKESNTKLAFPGDILLVTTASIGKIAIASFTVAVNQQITIISTKNKNKADNEFLYYAIKYFFPIKFNINSRGAAQIHINQKMIQRFQIPLPPLEEQKRIVSYLDAISERARQLVKLYEEREKELEKLWFSALDKAFKGML